MASLFGSLFGRAEKKSEETFQPVPPKTQKYDQEYIDYCIELEQTVSALEAYLHTSDDPKEIAMETHKTACRFYGGDWAGILDVDLELDVWSPLWWYNLRSYDRTMMLFQEFEIAKFMPNWVRSLDEGSPIVIYLYDFGTMPGSVQNGIRPVLIIQDNRFNENSPTTIVAAITSVIKKERLPSHIFLGQEFGLSKPSIFMLEQIRTVNQNELGEYIGAITDLYIAKILGRGIKKTLGMWDYTLRDKTAIRCLCPKCVEMYRNTGSFIIRRLDPFQKSKDTCDRYRHPGWDYVVINRKQN